MELFSIPGTKLCLVAGLQWQVLDPFEAKFISNAQIKELIDNGARHFVQYKNRADINYGVGFQTDKEQYRSFKIISIAAKIACDKQLNGTTSFVVINNDKTEGQLCFVIALLSGNTIFDRLVPIHEVDSILVDFQTICERSKQSAMNWGDVTTDGFTPEKALTLDQILDKKFGKTIELADLHDNRTTNIVLLVGGTVAILFGLWTAYDWYASKAKLAIAQERARQNTPEHLYSKSVERMLSEPTLVAPAIWDDYRKQLGSFPTQMGGWNLESISCKLTTCEALWKTQGSTYEEFKIAAKSKSNWGPISLNNSERDVLADLKTIRHSVTLNLSLQKLPPSDSWPNANEFAQTIGVQWQKLKPSGWDATLAPLEQQALPTGISPSVLSRHPKAIYAMRWEVKNQIWERSKEVISTFDKNMTITQVDITFEHKKKHVIFNAGGYAYAKK